MRNHEQKTKPVRIGISGSYGGLNLGDEAILHSMVAQIRASLQAEITVFSRDPKDTLTRHAVDRALAVRTLTREEIRPEIERLDIFVLGGGGILYDADARTYLREVQVAEELGIPVILYAVGAGPLKDPVIQKDVRRILQKVKRITVRDRVAKQVLEGIGLEKEVLVTADPALLLEPEPIAADALKNEIPPTDRRLVGISVREPGVAAPDIHPEHYHALLADTADFMIDRFDANIVFVPMERKVLDLQQSHSVMSRMLRPQYASVLRGDYTPGQILSLMGKMDFAVGMRLHFLIFAALQGVAFVALPYSPKVQGLLDEFGMEMPPFHLVSAGRLIAHIDESWDNRARIRAHIQKTVPELCRRAHQSHQQLVEVLRENKPVLASV